jgi:hypothetical protein
MADKAGGKPRASPPAKAHSHPRLPGRARAGLGESDTRTQISGPRARIVKLSSELRFS